MGRMSDVYGYQGSISEFLRDDYFGAQNLKRFRAMWVEIVSLLGFQKITYEECQQDLGGAMSKVLVYYGFSVDPLQLSEALANSDFSKMKVLEDSGKFPEPWLRRRNNAPKLRKGKVGGFRETLSEEDIAYLNDIFADQISV
jgi:hypothetical protein